MVSNTCNITPQLIHGYTVKVENKSLEKHIFIPASRHTLIAHALKIQHSKFKLHTVPSSLSCVGNHTKDVKTLTVEWPSSKFKFQTGVLLHHKNFFMFIGHSRIKVLFKIQIQYLPKRHVRR